MGRTKKFTKRVLGVLLTIIMILSTVTVGLVYAVGTDYYVDAENGSDSNTGTQSSPFQTVAKAREALGSSAGTLHFADGEYYIDSTISYTSGSNTITYKADGDNVVFTGGQRVTGWESDELNGRSCWSASVETSTQIELYNSSTPLQNSRMPNTGYYFLSSGSDAQSSSEYFASNASVITKLTDTSALASCDLSHSFIRIMHFWTEELLVIGSYNATSGKITFNTDYGSPTSMNTANAGDPYYFENVECGFDTAGEWYMDYANQKLYYIPQSSETMSGTAIYIGTNEQLFKINGANNIHFEGINFKNTGWQYTSNYAQSAYGSKAAILVYNASGIEFTNCTFENIGASAINFGNWGTGNTKSTSDCSVTGCKFNHIGASAVVVGGANNSYCPSSITISDNLIQNYGFSRQQATGLFVTHANNIDITNNEVHDGLYTGISVGWSWGYNTTNNHDNNISNNLIYNIGHGALSDMGGIYVLGIQENSTISNNVIYSVCTGDHCTTYGGWGIYTDEGSEGWSIYNNIVYDCGSQGFHQHYGNANNVYNNIFAMNEEGQVRSSACNVPASSSEDTSGEGKLYKSSADGSQFNLYNNILVGDDQYMYQQLNANYFTDTNNVYWDYTNGTAVISQSSSYGSTDVSTVQSNFGTNAYNNGNFENPNFVDVENRNFNLSSSSTVVTDIGFNSIDISNVGSSTYKSVYLLNDLANAEKIYSPTLWTAWETAKANAVYNRTDASADALEKAYKALAIMDNYSDYVIDFSLYYYGDEYDAYMEAYNAVEADAEDGVVNASTVTLLKTAYNTLVNTEYTITFGKLNGASSTTTSTVTYKYGETITLNSLTPSSSSIKFIGWLRTTDSTVLSAGAYTCGSGSYTINADWADAFTLYFTSNGGTWTYGGGSAQKSETVGYGESLKSYIDSYPITRSGYLFDGWYYNGTLYDENSTMPHNDLTLTAKWSTYHTIYFDNIMGEFYSESTYSTYFGINTDAPHNGVDLSNFGLIFDKSSKAVGVVATDSDCYAYMTKKGLELTAGHTYRLTYVCSGTPRLLVGFMSSSDGFSEAESSNNYIETSSKSFTFTMPTGRQYLSIRVGIHNASVGQIVVYGVFCLQDITETPGKGVPSQTMMVLRDGEAIGELPTLAYSGYVFKGWDVTNNPGTTVNLTEATTLTCDAIAWPVYEETTTLYFDNEFDFDTAGNMNDSQNLQGVSDITVSENEQSVSFTVTKPEEAYVSPANDITNLTEQGQYRIYYNFTVNNKENTTAYRMTVNPGNWSSTDSTKYWENVAPNTIITLKAGYNHIQIRPGALGGKTSEGDLIEYSNIAIQPLADETVSQPILNGQVTYTKLVYNGTAYGDLPTVTRDGYRFLGWYTERTGGVRVTSTTECTTVGASLHLYSHWISETADSTIKNIKSANSSYAVVPETIYMNPGSTVTDATDTGQYFVNNTFTKSTKSITTDAEKATTGKLYFYNSDAKSLSISFENAATIDMDYKTSPSAASYTDGGSHSSGYEFTYSTSSNNGIYYEGIINTYAYSSTIEAGKSLQETVKFTYTTYSGSTETTYAYITLYSPYTTVVATGYLGRYKTTQYIIDGYANNENITTWVTGIHGTTVDAGDSSFYKGNSNQGTATGTYDKVILKDKTVSAITISRSDTSSTDYLAYISGGTTYYGVAEGTCNGHSEGAYGFYGYNSTIAVLYADNSRYTNLGQIPDFRIGLDVHEYWTNWENNEAFIGYGISQNTKPSGTTQTANYSNCYSDEETFSDTKYAGARLENTKLNEVEVLDISSTDTANEDYYVRGRAYSEPSRGSSYSGWANAYVRFRYIPVNKSALRSAVQKYTSLNYQPSWFEDYNSTEGTSTQYNTYLAVLKVAEYYLGKPDATATEISNACDNLEAYDLVTLSYDNLFGLTDFAKNSNSATITNQTVNDSVNWNIGDNTIRFVEDGTVTETPVYTACGDAKYYTITVQPSTTYQISYSVKANSSTTNSAMLIPVALTGTISGMSTTSGVVALSGKTVGEYTTVTDTFTTSADCTSIQLEIGYSGSAASDITFKDIRVIPVSYSTYTYGYTATEAYNVEYIPDLNSVINNIKTPVARTGYTFVGWYDTYNPDYIYDNGTHALSVTPTFSGTLYETGSPLATDSDGEYQSTYLWSTWRQNTFTIEYNANGGIGTMDSQTMAYGNNTISHTFSANEFTKTDYVFLNWNTRADGSGTSYNPGENISNTLTDVDGDVITLYAQWAKQSTLTLNANGGHTCNNLIYFKDGYETFSDTFANAEGCSWNGSYNSTRDGVNLSVTMGAVSGERYLLTDGMQVNLIKGHQYKLSFTSNNPGVDFFLYKDFNNKADMRYGYYTGRMQTITQDNGNGTYTYNITFTCGDWQSTDTDSASEHSMVSTNELTGTYNFRTSYYAKADEITYQITDLRVVDITESTDDHSLMQLSGTTRKIENPYREGYYFTGWDVTGGNMNGTTYSFTEEDGTLSANWIFIAQNHSYTIDYGSKVTFDVCVDEIDAVVDSITLSTDNTSFTSSLSNANWVATVSGTNVVFTPESGFMSLSDSIVFYYKVVLTDGNTSTAKITVIPANNIYYEAEDFMTFTDGINSWKTNGSGSEISQSADAVGSARNYGYDESYDTSTLSYSNSVCKSTTVNANTKDNPASATFTFTGTGFDIFALTSNKIGTTQVTITDKDGKKVGSYLYTGYTGYGYGQVYLVASNRISLTKTATSKLLYYALDSMTAPTYDIYNFNNARLTSTPTYYTSSGTLTTTNTGNPAYAYGWISDENNTDCMYQVPVISKTGLDYGTYTVTITPKYLKIYDFNNVGSYDFYIDSVRIYNPLGLNIDTSSSAGKAYLTDNEYNAQYKTLRDVIIEQGSFDAGTTGYTTGVAYIDFNKSSGTPTISTYENSGPKNELYLQKGQAVVFNLTEDYGAEPSGLQIGMRAVGGSGSGTIAIFNANQNASEHTYTVSGATEQYRDISSAAVWSLSGGKYTTTTPIIIMNTSDNDVVISLTKLKCTFADTITTSSANGVEMIISEEDLQCAFEAMQSIGKTSDFENISVNWQNKLTDAYSNAILEVETDENIRSLTVDGNSFTECEQLEGGKLLWTYKFDLLHIGTYNFSVIATDIDGNVSNPISTPNLKVVAPVVSTDNVQSSVASNVEKGDDANLTITTGDNIESITVDSVKYTDFVEKDGARIFTIPVDTSSVGIKDVSYYVTDVNGFNSIVVKQQVNVGNATIDTSGTEIKWQSDSINIGDTAVLNIKTNDTITKVTVNGEAVNGTYSVKPSATGTYTYKVVISNAKGVIAEYTTDILTVNSYTVNTDNFNATLNANELNVGDKATVSVTTSSDIQYVTINSEKITEYKENANGTRTFSYTFTSDEECEVDCTYSVTDINSMNSETQYIGSVKFSSVEKLSFWQRIINFFVSMFGGLTRIFEGR